MRVGAASPEAFVPMLRMQNAFLPRPGKSRSLVGVQGDPGWSTRWRMRRLVGLCGGAARRDVLVGPDFDVSSGDEDDFEKWAAFR